MFSELPKLLDRNFAIAYFLPVSLFVVVSIGLLKAAGYWSKVETILTGTTIIDATLAILASWITGTVLLVLNREIYRILEGYGDYNPLRLFLGRTKQKFLEKLDRLKYLDGNFENLTLKEKEERTILMKELAKSYPDAAKDSNKAKYLLPTSFGNALRAFEVYPRVMYGLEGIDGWPRILAVLPKDYRELIDSAKAQIDWWVNLIVMSFLFLVEFWYVVFSKWGTSPGWFYTALNISIPLVLFALLNWIFLWRATSAAIGWGDYVKSAFDLYRFDLLEKLHIAPPKTREEERELWTSLSRAIIFRKETQLPMLKIVVEKKETKDNEK
jgi:hypothetical protein